MSSLNPSTSILGQRKAKHLLRRSCFQYSKAVLDQFAALTDVSAFISAERSALREELIPFLTVALKVDRDANMGIVGDVKQELRKVNALKINYTTGIGDVETNFN